MMLEHQANVNLEDSRVLVAIQKVALITPKHIINELCEMYPILWVHHVKNIHEFMFRKLPLGAFKIK
jgi:hypothetical protein